MLDVFTENLIAPFTVLGSPTARPHPLGALPNGAVREICGVPKLRGDELGGMEVRADHAPFTFGQFRYGSVEVLEDRGVRFLMVEIRANLILSEVEDVQQPSVPGR